MNIRVLNVCLLLGWLMVTAGGVIVHPGWGLAVSGGALIVIVLATAYIGGIYDPVERTRAAAARRQGEAG